MFVISSLAWRLLATSFWKMVRITRNAFASFRFSSVRFYDARKKEISSKHVWFVPTFRKCNPLLDADSCQKQRTKQKQWTRNQERKRGICSATMSNRIEQWKYPDYFVRMLREAVQLDARVFFVWMPKSKSRLRNQTKPTNFKFHFVVIKTLYSALCEQFKRPQNKTRNRSDISWFVFFCECSFVSCFGLQIGKFQTHFVR